jgi:hypothetical protein
MIVGSGTLLPVGIVILPSIIRQVIHAYATDLLYPTMASQLMLPTAPFLVVLTYAITLVCGDVMRPRVHYGSSLPFIRPYNA